MTEKETRFANNQPNIARCSETNNDIIEAVALKFNVPQPKKKVQDSTQTFFSKVSPPVRQKPITG